ncbi:mucin-like protein isoform x2 [Plakobranchus ocellatus]|uniref:Mucin-like protein isoform x2 n=1 Tax=Plakobranchus ocellatus TaxID=259542 RepID=A0AAV3Z9C8_9GAST|nr:mucin-like protein isoform x2 [Plakobranchus ocellatus]
MLVGQYMQKKHADRAVYAEEACQYSNLYPYGSSAGDSVLERNTSVYWYWYYSFTSEIIRFNTGAPFGERRLKFAHVLPNGVITFGSPHRVWWPNFRYAQFYTEKNILAPFWHSVNWRSAVKVYYQLYERPGSNGQVVTPAVDTWSSVLDRAKAEVEETLGVEGFNPTSALVATWERVEPYSWWTWICENYERYRNSFWWMYYQPYYDQYCLTQNPEANTFQCVYVTDGQVAYAIVTYKAGEMTWRYDRYRSIEVGYSSPSQTRDFGYRYTDLTTKLDTNTFNTGRYGTWIEKVGEFESTDARCLNFFIENIYMVNNSTHNAILENLYKCPCTMDRLGFQWTWYARTRVPGRSDITYRACFVLGRKRRDRRIRNNPHNKMCCYYYTYPTTWSWFAFREARRNAPYIPYRDINAGHILKHDPRRSFWWRDNRVSKQEDFDPKNWCCRDSSLPSIYCHLFYAVRPDLGCSNEVDWFLGEYKWW